MYHVLIVEDEMLVRMGIKNSIDWPKFGMEVIADVSEGKAAWEIYERESPDLVITDIKMPVMDGMELITKIRDKDNYTKILILSCLEEFELARKAATLGVSGYILKLSMSFDEIEELLGKIKRELDKMDSEKKLKSAPTVDRGLLKEELFKNYIFYRLYSPESFEKQLEELRCRLKPSKLILCVMDLDEYERLQDTFRDEKGQLIKFSLLNVINEVLDSYERGEVFQDDNRRYVIIFTFFDKVSELKIREELNKILEHLIRVFRSFFNLPLSFGVSSIKAGYDRLNELYEEGNKALKLKFFAGQGSILYWDAKISPEQFEKSLAGLKALPMKLFDSGLLEDKHCAEMSKKINEVLAQCNIAKEQIIDCLCGLIHLSASFKNLPEATGASAMASYLMKIVGTETLESALDIVTSYFLHLNNAKNKMITLSREIAEAVKLIQQNYDKEISVQQIAEKVGLSPNYLSSLFKKELNLNFIDYLNYIRVENAKRLLRETGMKSYEIAEKVGFSHDSYFSKTFKKMTGINPNEYKRQFFARGTGDGSDEYKQNH